VLEIIFGVGVLTVGIDTYKFDAPRGEFFSRLPSDFVRADDIGTMVTGEEDYQYLVIKIR